MVDNLQQPTESPQTIAQPLLVPSMETSSVPASTYDNSTPQSQVAQDVAAEPAQAPAQPKQPLSYQDQITKLQSAGFSGDEIQDYSIKQAVKLRQAGFSQDEVDAYQGMKPPAVPGGTPIYGHVPTDKDFQNAASVILGGNDHPSYEKAVDTLKNLFTSTGVSPSDAVKVANAVPSFQEIMENGGEAPTWGDYGSRLAHDAGSAVAGGMQGLAAIKAYVNPNDPGVPVSEQGANPETTQMYQKGAAFQQWINDKLPENQKLNDANPIKMGIAGGIGSLIPLLATGGVGMAATGAGSSYQESRQAGANPEKASAQATKMGAVWGVLGVADVGMFLKPIQRSAPGVIPWITAKATQAVRSGLTFAGTNELGDWLSSEIGQASDIPLQYKPTVQRIVVNALTGAMAGAISPTGIKQGEKVNAEPPSGGTQSPSEEPSGGAATSPQNDMGYKGDIPHITVRPEGEPVQQPNAPVSKYTPAYHFDTDSYGVKNDKGEFVKTGIGSEEEAAQAATEMAKPVVQEKQPIAPEIVNRYKQTVSDEAEKMGFALTPKQLDQVAKVMAESHNPEGVEKPRSLAEVQGKTSEEHDKTQTLQKKQQSPVEDQKVAKKPISTVSKLETFPDLPKELKSAKSGYKTAIPQFASDVDKALYIVREKSSGKSKSHDKYIDYLKNTVGLSDGEIRKGSEDVLNAVKSNAEGQTGKVDIPSTFKRTGGELSAESIAANKKMQARINRSEAGKKSYQERIKNAAGKDPTTFTNFLHYLADNGGIKNDGGSEKISNLGLGKDVPVGLITKKGMSHKMALEKAIDDRWIPNKDNLNGTNENDLNDLYNLIADKGKSPHPESDGKIDDLRYQEDLERHAGEMGIDTTGMKPDEIHDALEIRTKESALEHDYVEEIKSDEAAHDYYPDMEEHYDESTFEGSHTEREPKISTSDERSELKTDNERRGEGTQSGDATDVGRGTEGTGADTGRAGNSFEPAKNIAGGGEQGVLGGMEQSAKQAMEARGEKIKSKSEQKDADEGLFAPKDEDRGEFLFRKSGSNRGITTNYDKFEKLAEGVLGKPSEAFDEKSIQVAEDLKNLLKKIAPTAKLGLFDEIISTKNKGNISGAYISLSHLIAVATHAENPTGTMLHEAIHFLRDKGLFTKDEWNTLSKKSDKENWIKKYDIENRYKEEGHPFPSHDFLTEEAIAEHMANEYGVEKTGVIDKIKSLWEGLKSIAAKVFGTGATPDDIFKSVLSGDVGNRESSEISRSDNENKFQKEKKDKPTLGDALKGIRDTFSPTSAGNGAKNTEVALRESYGQAKRDQAIAETALNEFARQANEMTPAEHEDFYNYVEGRSTGAQLKNPQFQRMADAIRNIYANYKDALQKMPETRMMNFVQDYFTHQWAKGQDEKIKEFMNSWWQQGSSRNLKERKIPTIADGLAYGLRLEEPNPVRAVSRYVGSMSHYMASVNVLRAINTELGGAFYADGKQPEGYAPLVGRNAERIENARVDEESGKVVPAKNLHLYAPREVADLYNAFYSKGFEDTKLGSAYMLVRNAINTNTLLELGLSAYHFSTINVQSFNQDVGRILKNAFVGDWQGVGQAIKGLVTPALHFVQGSKLMEQYKDLKDHGVDMEKITNLFAASNMRLGIDPLSNISNHGGFYKAWQRGELPGLIDRLKSQLTEGYGLGALKTGAETVGKVVSDISHPLFNAYVPAMKMSAFHDLMGDWLRQNPKASDGEISVNALRISNMVEDRFGEMNMENIFWNQKAKELLGLTLRAPGWDIGLVRQVGGAGLDFYKILRDAVSKGRNFNSGNLDRPLFMVGAVMSYVAMNAAMTYVKTGIMPSDQKMKDWIAYATGGVHKAFGWHPEQAELPGHGRELIQLSPNPGQGPLSGVTQEVSNKVATLPKKLYEIGNNTDWNGKPIYDPKSNSWVKRTPGVAQVAHIAEGFKPFSMEQLFEGQQPGSHLSFAERFMGVRAAGAKITAPEKLKEYNEKHH